MTAQENKSVTPRADRAFRFFVDGDEFFPGAGSRLHYASQAVDTLTLVDVPDGLLTSSAVVSVTYRDTCVFQGTVEQIVDKHGRGDTRSNDVTCQGPWGKMQRLVFRQQWGFARGDTSVVFKSSRVILNQSPAGIAYTQAEQLNEIVAYGAAKCGYAYAAANVEGKSINLPLDETRDVTVAAAIQRELKFFPKTVVRFDYAENPPAIHIHEPSGMDASYVASMPKTARQYEYNAHPITGVYLYTADSTLQVNGVTMTETAQKYPSDADPEDIDCMSAYIPLAPSSGSTSWARFEAEGEEIGTAYQYKAWWMARHPRLANVAEANIVLTEIRRSNTDYNYIAAATTEELAAAGLHSKICRFSCKAKIDTGDDVEEEIYLTMDYLTTDAVPGNSYTWQTGSSYTAGETIPEGLAEAIFRQRSGALKNETTTIRLGNAFPVLGDRCDGLILQEYDVDCDTQTASLHFGQPEYLSIDDMRGLLSGFRGRGYASNAPTRMGMGEESSEDGEDKTAKALQPLSSTEFCPGRKLKTTIGGADAGGTINLDPTDLGGAEIKPRSLTVGSAGARSRSGGGGVKILASEDVVLPNGSADVSAGQNGVDVDGKRIYVTVKQPTSGSGEAIVVDLSTTPDTEPTDNDGCCNTHSKDEELDDNDWSNDELGGLDGTGGGGGGGADAGGNSWSGDRCPLTGETED